ncbi:MAG TPA: gliding motility protein GldN [Bacteroidia bacterium]|nr:gliding motility protein GldN [Bacteroidia bacterium]
MKKFILILSVLIGFGSLASAQNVLDGVYVRESNPARRVIPYTYLREADVMWAKRIWRHIDLNEKINAPLRYPKSNETKDRKNLINTLMDAVKEGTLTAYDPQDDEFTLPMTTAEFLKVGGADSITIKVTRPDPPYDEYDSVVFRAFNPDDVIQYRIKEEWFFDKQRSVMESRIIGMAPMTLARDQEGNLIEGGQKKLLFWVYFPEARRVLVNAEVANRFNSAQRLTFDDIFAKRMFNSYIIKEDNVYNRRIDDYKANPLDALLESERIKQEMINFEIDLWEY